MKVRAHRFIGAMLIYALGVVSIAVASYLLEQKRYMDDIDSRLLAAASNIPTILPTNFHDIARTPDAISEEQDRYNLELMSQHTRSGDLTYLYSYVMVDGMIYFTSCNYTDEDVEKNQVVTYWTSYPEGSPEYFEAMTAKEPVYVTAGDRWGLFRTILIPMTSPGGQPYVAAADMDITVIQESLRRRVLHVFGIGLILLLLAVPLVLAYRRTYFEMSGRLLTLNQQLQDDINQAMKLEAELKDATDKANKANLVKSQFLANMSHELRTPINGVLGMNQLLLDMDLSAEQREYARLTNQSAKVLLDTVNQILDQAALEGGGLILKTESTLTVPFFEDVLQMFSSQISDKKLDLTLHVAHEVPAQIEIDAVRLRQVLSNLISNAIKFTYEGSVQIFLTWQNGTLAGEVKDTGIGIPTDAQQRVFETFQQVDNSSTRHYCGTGLGLPISKQICSVMGGDLQLAHSDQNGSTFVFSIQAPSCSDEPEKPIELTGCSNVLVVTPEAAMVAWFEHELSVSEITLQVKNTLASALPKLREADVIFVDSSMGDNVLEAMSDSFNPSKQRLICLAWLGQKLPDNVYGRVEILSKPLTRSGMAQFYSQDSAQSQQLDVSLSGRILLVDDNMSNLKAIGDQLRSTGLDVELADNGKEAIARCAHDQFDLVLMDLQMPGMDGLEATRLIQEILSDEAPPIVGISARVMEEDIILAKKEGMADYLCKPVTKDVLLEKVAEFLKEPSLNP